MVIRMLITFEMLYVLSSILIIFWVICFHGYKNLIIFLCIVHHPIALLRTFKLERGFYLLGGIGVQLFEYLSNSIRWIWYIKSLMLGDISLWPSKILCAVNDIDFQLHDNPVLTSKFWAGHLWSIDWSIQQVLFKDILVSTPATYLKLMVKAP